ncbi:MAG: hypothetical protein NVS3B20_00470 [Polyangiales bacterium]
MHMEYKIAGLIIVGSLLAACGASSSTAGDDQDVISHRKDAGSAESGSGCGFDAGAPANIPLPQLTAHGRDTGLTVTTDPGRPNVIVVSGIATGLTSAGTVSSLSVDIDGRAQNFYTEPVHGDSGLDAVNRLKNMIDKHRGDAYVTRAAQLESGAAELTVTRAPNSDGKDHSSILPGLTVKSGSNGRILLAGQTPSDQWDMSHTSSVAGNRITIVIDPSTVKFGEHIQKITAFQVEVWPGSDLCVDLHGSFHVVVANYKGLVLTESDVSL